LGAPGGTAPFVGGGGGIGSVFSSGGRTGTGILSAFGGIKGLTGLFKSFKSDGLKAGDIDPASGDTIANAGFSPGAKTAAGIGAQLAIAGGTSLFTAGIFGNRRGTGGGILEGTAGGALAGAGIGFELGGPLGAGIGALSGAAAGLLIGAGEKIAGVESPRNEAKRLVKSQFGITINNPTADQIVAIARQSYASHVSLAVRSPEVRQMLGLYAAGTGQARNFPQGADTPHGGGLVESGGRLFQQTTSLYGNQYAYSSNLPVYGGTAGVGTFPSPGGGGGNISLSLNVDGDGISPFMQGQVITPSYVAQAQAAAWRGSQGRVDAALALSQPGSIAS
jgi:hypothetical protein